MSIHNIEELKKNINKSTAFIFIIIFFASVLGVFLIHASLAKKKAYIHKEEIITAGKIYKANLSEKLSIIASSTVFLDYLHSGNLTRKFLNDDFLTQLSLLKSKSISGMSLLDSNNQIIFNYGNETPLFVTLNLCYLNQTLDPDMGECSFSWRLFFNYAELLKEITSINNAIKICKNCVPYNLIDSNQFGSFKVKNNSNFSLQLGVSAEIDYFFYLYLMIMIVSLVLFGSWNWYRLNKMINTYIATPIKNLTTSLKSNLAIEPSNNIEEIEYLASEINHWKIKLNQIQLDEQAAKLGKIAAQLAHDVRSPLSAIDILVQDLPNIPENIRIILCNAIKRISEIANNFLMEFRNPKLLANNEKLVDIHIPSLLENMIYEKRLQYAGTPIKISFFIEPNAWDSFCLVNPSEFGRMISNLINNAIEAIAKSGDIAIRLSKQKKCYRIEINDNGVGISDDLLPTIILLGGSFGKEKGSGLGLSHALRKIKEWGGDIDIKSTLGIGTEIGISLPISTALPDWCMNILTISNAEIICILDDQLLTHNLWKKRFNHIAHSNLINHFFTIESFIDFILENDSKPILYLIDYDLQDAQTGLDLIEKYKLFNAILVTNLYEEDTVQQRCSELNVKMIPKILITKFPIRMNG